MLIATKSIFLSSCNSRLIKSSTKSIVFSTVLIFLGNGLNFLVLERIGRLNPLFGGIKHS